MYTFYQLLTILSLKSIIFRLLAVPRKRTKQSQTREKHENIVCHVLNDHIRLIQQFEFQFIVNFEYACFFFIQCSWKYGNWHRQKDFSDTARSRHISNSHDASPLQNTPTYGDICWNKVHQKQKSALLCAKSQQNNLV